MLQCGLNQGGCEPRGMLKLGWPFTAALILDGGTWTNNWMLAAPGRDVILGGTALSTVTVLNTASQTQLQEQIPQS